MDGANKSGKRLLKLRGILGLGGKIDGGRSWFLDGVRRGEFPQPIKIGRSTFWIEDEIDSWIGELAAKRETRAGQ